MGSYVGIGLICIESDKKLTDLCCCLLKECNPINYYVEFPASAVDAEWTILTNMDVSLEDALEICFSNQYAQIVADFQLPFLLYEVLISIAKEDNMEALLLQIPDYCLKQYGIDCMEERIVALLEYALVVGFQYGFCDHEAELPTSFEEIDNSIKKYSIQMQYTNGEIRAQMNPWKIDGLTAR